MSYTTALVTGGSGFIGSHIVDALVARGVAVTVIDLVEPRKEDKNPRAVYKIVDIRDQALTQVFLGIMPEVVFHCAAHIDDRASVLDPMINADHNIMGTLNVLEASRKAGVKRFVFASTGIAYGRADVLPTPESALSRPLTPYAVSKLACERYLKCYEVIHGLSWMALRFANVYGPRQDGSKECGAIAIFTKRLFADEAVNLNNDGQTTRDYIHVSDVVSACLAAAESTACEVVNIGTAQQTTTRDILAIVEEAVRRQAVIFERPEVADMVKHCALAIEKARSFLRWAPTIPLKIGIEQTVEWYKNRV